MSPRTYPIARDHADPAGKWRENATDLAQGVRVAPPHFRIPREAQPTRCRFLLIEGGGPRMPR
jgi:hypothetical protein